ncbi:MAG: hypothetical protein KAG34_11510, partial [Cocleimonas sp.]|nr:hypothetical protein [Cocleimonas sp.]
KHVNKLGLSGRNADTKLTNISIIRYPSPKFAITQSRKSESNQSTPDTPKKKQQITNKLCTRVAEIWVSDVWARGQRRHYHALRALQILKVQIFRDKLTVYREAEYSGLISGSKKNSGIHNAALLVLFDAIKKRIAKIYIPILRTHQQNLSKSLSYGLQDYPRPLIERRRNIGIFADYLSERTHDIQKDMLHLINIFQTEEEKNNQVNENRSAPLILHGWSPYPYASNMQLFDNVGRKSNNLHNNKVEDVNYVDSSFWAPDRPDLQPLIAHEVANLCVCHVFKNLSDDYISNTNNDLTRLVSELFYEINQFTKKVPELQPVQKNIRTLLVKIFSDLLAASVKGISYVYALFLSVVGKDLGNLLVDQTRVRLDRVTELHTGIASIKDYFQWYFRLKLCAFWMKKVMHIPTNHLDNIVLDGVAMVCDDLIGFLDSSTPDSRDRVGGMWQKLEFRLENIINRSPLVMRVRNWRANRSCDSWDENKDCNGKKLFFRSTKRLDLRLQNYLFREVLNNKLKRDNNAEKNHQSKTKLIHYFQDKYGLGCEKIPVPNVQSKVLEQPRWLFRHLYDIPFQCAAMRSIDLLEHRNTHCNTQESYQWQNFIETTHDDISLGRELFSLALEFYTWERESARSRLLLCVNLMTFSLIETSEWNIDFFDRLKIWLGGRSSNNGLLNKLYDKYGLKADRRNIATLIYNLTQHSHAKVKNLFIRENKLTDLYLQYMGAIDIADVFSTAEKTYYSGQERRLDQIAGYKLHELYQILNEFKQYKNFPETFLAAIEYLSIHSSFRTEYNHDDDAYASSRFYALILSALGDSYNYRETQQQILAETDLPSRSPFVMVNYISMTNYYPVADPFHPTEHPKSEDEKEWNPNGLSLKQGMELGSWNGYAHIEQKNQFFPTLGQYDAIGFVNVKLPCKCRIPSFEKNNTGYDSDTEKFITHFSLREIAIPVRITQQKTQKSAIKPLTGYLDGEVSAVISISLQRRSMRLNILYRILQAINNIDKTSKTKKHGNMERKLFDFYSSVPKDMCLHALLTDGWGDVLLVFSKKDDWEKERDMDKFVDYIFELQEALYEDFMVDRTEITFMPKCLDSIMYNENYGIRVNLRFMEDRRLEQSLSKYLKAYTDATKQSDEGTPEGVLLNNANIVRTPGRMDFAIQINASTKYKRRENVHKTLIKVLATIKKDLNPWFPDALSMLSKVETVIELKHNGEKKQA